MKSLKSSYDSFHIEFERIHQYFIFSGLSFALVGTMQDQAKECAKSIKPQIDKKNISYSKSDSKVNDVILLCEWISLDEYSRRENLSIDEVEKQAIAGLLGRVHIDENQKFIIWPKEMQQEPDLPEFGQMLFSVKVEQKFGTTAVIENRDEVLSLLGEFPNLKNIITQSKKRLRPTCLLLYWTVFEAYIKDFIETLYFLHPEQVFKKYGKNEMTLNAVFDGSRKFTDIESLKHRVLDEVLAKYDRENISKLIEFVSDCYLAKGVDPFSIHFTYNGTKQEETKEHLEQIRIIRNSLIHDNGFISEKEWKRIDLIDRKGDSQIVSISDDELGKMYYILKSIAYNIYQLTLKQYPETN